MNVPSEATFPVTVVATPNGFLAPHAGETGVTYQYQWFRYDGPYQLTKIAGATKASYTVAPADVASGTMLLEFRAVKPNYLTVWHVAGTVDIHAGAITGSLPVDVHFDFATTRLYYIATLDKTQILTPGVTFTGQWYKNGSAIPGATGLTFKPANPTAREGTYKYQVRISKPGYTDRYSAGQYTYT